jgi:hypothetical protein
MPQDLDRLASFSMHTWVVEEGMEGEGVWVRKVTQTMHTLLNTLLYTHGSVKMLKGKKTESVFFWI